MTEKTILVADDESHILHVVSLKLRNAGYRVVTAHDGVEALEMAQNEKPDLLITELVLPELSGLGLCRLLREDPALGHLGIVMVTSFAAEIDRVLAFECGVDDVLAKPFFARELLSRATAVLRRSAPAHEPIGRVVSTYQPAVSLHVNTGTVLVGGERLTLTPREFHLLSALMRESGRVFSRRQLIHQVWGNDSLQAERVVDAHIKAIRRKLGAIGECVETVRGVGYRYAESH
jgi:DNA-binding response OmpR family regulator